MSTVEKIRTEARTALLSTTRFRTWPMQVRQVAIKVLSAVGVVGCIFGCSYSAALLATMVASLCATHFSTEIDVSVVDVRELNHANGC